MGGEWVGCSVREYFQHYWLIFKGSVLCELNFHCDLSSQCPTPSGILVLSSNSVFADPSCPHVPCVLCYLDRSSILLPSPLSSAWLQNVDRMWYYVWWRSIAFTVQGKILETIRMYVRMSTSSPLSPPWVTVYLVWLCCIHYPSIGHLASSCLHHAAAGVGSSCFC